MAFWFGVQPASLCSPFNPQALSCSKDDGLTIQEQLDKEDERHRRWVNDVCNYGNHLIPIGKTVLDVGVEEDEGDDDDEEDDDDEGDPGMDEEDDDDDVDDDLDAEFGDDVDMMEMNFQPGDQDMGSDESM